jgi:hypothetical protein
LKKNSKIKESVFWSKTKSESRLCQFWLFIPNPSKKGWVL